MKHYGHMVRVLHCTISQSVTAALAEMELTSAQGRIMGYLAMSPEPPCAKDIEVTGFTEAEKQQFADLLTRAAKNLGCDPQFRLNDNKEESE